MGSWICVFLPLLLPHPTIAFQMDFAYEEIQYPSTPPRPLQASGRRLGRNPCELPFHVCHHVPESCKDQ